MPANSANPALGIGQKPGATAAADAELEVACAIYCCDKKAYPLLDNRGGEKTCQRLAARKHSCVTHALREKDGDKLTQTNKFSNILAAPRYDHPVHGRLVPDVIAGNTVIDAKFPCDPSKVNFSNGGKVVNLSTGALGKSYMGDKELNQYPDIKGVKDVKAKTPADAAKDTDDGAKCQGKTC